MKLCKEMKTIVLQKCLKTSLCRRNGSSPKSLQLRSQTSGVILQEEFVVSKLHGEERGLLTGRCVLSCSYAGWWAHSVRVQTGQ